MHIYPSLDPFTEQNLSLQLYSTEQQFEIVFHAKGHWNEKEVFKQPLTSKLTIEDEQYSEQEWQYVISSQEERL